MTAEHSPTVAAAGVPPGERLRSLDAFRGFTIAGMLLVNNKAADAAFHGQFSHAAWGEFPTYCDMIFPWFLFIVGVALPWSVASFRRKGGSTAGLLGKAAKRAAVLVFLGILIDCSVLGRIHIGMNVLQLIGLAFFAGVCGYLMPWRARAVVAAVLLALYMALILFVPIPGQGAGHFEASKNIIGWLNNQLRPWHLAGILSVIPAGALVMIGSLFGDPLRNNDSERGRNPRLLMQWGVVLAAAGLLLHFVLEMNKPVWTPSYILFAGGLGAIVFGVFYALIDVNGWRAWAFPFVVYGMNAIAAYFISIVVRIHTVQEWTMTLEDGTTTTVWKAMIAWYLAAFGESVGAWLFTGSYITFWFFVLLWMYRRGIFWKV